MRTALAIGLKELRVYLTTWTSYVLVGALLEIAAFFFYLLVKDFQLRRLQAAEQRALGVLEHMNLTDLVVGPTFAYLASFFVFLLPLLTMRTLAEERQQGSLELLQTLPVRAWEIVAGKFVAAWLVMCAMLALTVVFPLSLELLGGTAESVLDWRTVGTGYLGLLLLGSLGVAIGVCASAHTRSQIVAVVTAFLLLLLLLVCGVAARGQAEPWRGVLEALSISTHLQAFTRGLIRSPDLVYYLSLTGLALFFAHREVVMERFR